MIGRNYDDEGPSRAAGDDAATLGASVETSPSTGAVPASESHEPMVTSTKSAAWQRWQAAVREAHAASLEVPALDLPLSVAALEASTRDLLGMVAGANSPAQDKL